MEVAPTRWAPRWTPSQPPVWGTSTQRSCAPPPLTVYKYTTLFLELALYPSHLRRFRLGAPSPALSKRAAASSLLAFLAALRARFLACCAVLQSALELSSK